MYAYIKRNRKHTEVKKKIKLLKNHFEINNTTETERNR